MPKIGEVKRGVTIGRQKYHCLAWAACLDCGKERWVRVKQNKPINPRCRRCAPRHGPASIKWKGGKIIKDKGYIYILSPEHPFKNSIGYMAEHRLVMEKHLGRYLKATEFIHHKNAVKDDNRIENLQLVVGNSHRGIIGCPYCEKEFLIR